MPAATNSAAMIHSACRFSWLMPRSIASLARYGGASAAAVAASRKKIASAVRALYGAVSRASVVIRRAVACHDQSSTFAPRSRSRWLPGWWTLTAASLPNTSQGQSLGQVRAGHVRGTVPGRWPEESRCCLHAGSDLLLEQTVLVDVVVDGARRDELLLPTARGAPGP